MPQTYFMISLSAVTHEVILIQLQDSINQNTVQNTFNNYFFIHIQKRNS